MLFIDPQLPQAQLHAEIKEACCRLLTGWADLPHHSLTVTCIAGGISNALFNVRHMPAEAPGAQAAALGAAAATPPCVAFRIYGNNTDKFVDRPKELAVMKLVHQHGFGPSVLATFDNGRIEQFLAMRSLKPQEMAAPEFVPAIAASMRRFHSIPAPGMGQVRTPFLRIYEWLHIAEGFVFEDAERQQAFATFNFAAMRGEVQTVEAAAAALHSPTVFAHNDLLSGNIMVDDLCELPWHASGERKTDAADPRLVLQSSRKPRYLTFIDFEYADWAPRGFDWGNHFCEYAGFECDYTQYPQEQQAALFLEHYLGAEGQEASLSSDKAHELAQCMAEANVYALAAHQFWAAWALLQAKFSSIDFDYLAYARLRWSEFQRRKDEFLSQARHFA